VSRFLSLVAQTDSARLASEPGAVDEIAVLDLKRWHYSVESTEMRTLDHLSGVFSTQYAGVNPSKDARRAAQCLDFAMQLAGTGAQVLLRCPSPLIGSFTSRTLKESTAEEADTEWARRLRDCLMSPAVRSAWGAGVPFSHTSLSPRSPTQQLCR
jgi:hypothetical protein